MCLSFLPNEKGRKMCKIEKDFKKFCWCSNLSNDDLEARSENGYGFQRFAGMKTAVRNDTFGMKQGQDLENWMALTNEEFPGVPFGSNYTLLINKTMKNIISCSLKTHNLIKSNCRLMNPGETLTSGLKQVIKFRVRLSTGYCLLS